ncbi:hypothetical protein RRG08_063524 [Elysia crispata]|uniref:Uncharacterized protein n=1 Tax=Elysia crispata TaxID=231223 RepID=A0AAE1B2K0_9GAST|nr:hypothetical protein RRG08_063524 [Elysia crispata]
MKGYEPPSKCPATLPSPPPPLGDGWTLFEIYRFRGREEGESQRSCAPALPPWADTGMPEMVGVNDLRADDIVRSMKWAYEAVRDHILTRPIRDVSCHGQAVKCTCDMNVTSCPQETLREARIYCKSMAFEPSKSDSSLKQGLSLREEDFGPVKAYCD